MIPGIATDIVRIMRGLYPAAPVTQKLELRVHFAAQDLGERYAQLKAFSPVHTDRAQQPAIHIERPTPVSEGPDDRHGAVSDIRAEDFPEKEMHLAGLDPVAGTKRPSPDIGGLQRHHARRRVERKRRQARPHPVLGEHDESGDLGLPPCAGQVSRHSPQ